MHFIFTKPGYFTICFSLALFAILFGRAFQKGPRRCVRINCSKKYAGRTCFLLFSVVGAFVSSIVIYKWILAVFFCVLEFIAIAMFYCNASCSEDDEESDAKPLVRRSEDMESTRKTNETELK